jgi:replication-associated recombination protein RarA
MSKPLVTRVGPERHTSTNITTDRYQPQSIQDIVFASTNNKTLLQDLISGHIPFPITQGKCGILLYGIPGTGKSALAALLPDAMEEARTGIAMNSGMKYIRVQPGNNGMTMLNAVGNQAQLVPFASHHYFVFDEVDNLNPQAMLVLKSVMNTPNCVFILTTNNFQNVEVGVRSRCHCIPFNAAPAANWLPLAHRMLADAGITGIADQALIKVIDLCNGDARDIVTAIAALVLKVSRQRSAPSTVVV